MIHKFDETEYNDKVNARAELGLAHIPANSVIDLRERVDLLEIIVGITSQTVENSAK